MHRVTRDAHAHRRFLVARESDVPQVSAGTSLFCTQQGFSAVLAAHVATAASELANNLWMHAHHGGSISLRCCQQGARLGVEIVAQDQGPGIADLARALSEGWSSAGGMGCGLPGVQRLMDSFEIDSAPGCGTTVRARKWATRPDGRASMPPPRPSSEALRATDKQTGLAAEPGPVRLDASLDMRLDMHLDVAMLSAPLSGETSCGDACLSLPLPTCGGHWLALMDGLGHGEPAELAARLAQQEIMQHGPGMAGRPMAMLRHLDAALHATRGAAVGLAWLEGRSLSFAGMGNTRALRWRQAQVTRLASQHGIVGEGRAHRGELALRQEQLSLQDGDWLVMFSDGLNEMLHWDAILPAWQRDPMGLARHLLARWRQGRDDAAVLVARVSLGARP